jgi:uncharacterized damage-inducible protein DinB
MKPRAFDPIDSLLAHNLWATRQILEKCRGLSDEQFNRPFPIGPGDHGGLHAILTHIVGAMQRWSDRIAGRPMRPPLEGWRSPGSTPLTRTPGELLNLLEEAHRELAAVIAGARQQGETGEAGFAREVTLRFPSPEGSKTHTLTVGVAIASALVHGHYHRAQCMNILRQLDVPGASLDVIDWQQAIEGT